MNSNYTMTDEEAFRAALVWLRPIEGGWWSGGRSDPNPTMKGITQKTYNAFRRKKGLPLQSVRLVVDEEHNEIYRTGYWLAAGCHLLPAPLALVHFDAAVNHGVRNAARLKARINGSAEDPAQDYIRVRRAFYEAIIARNPDLEPNRLGWKRRMDKLARAAAKL